MEYKRILTIQDISCVGQCSMTVAMPILCACGHETCILPTAVLSTHTGGFGKPSVVHFGAELEEFRKHWEENAIRFDAILMGYLGSVAAVEIAASMLDKMLAPGGVSIVDPAFGDHGKRYSGLSEEYVKAMERLCCRADIILPNITEAACFSGEPYPDELEEAVVNGILDRLDHPCVILTGVGYEAGETGILLKEGDTKYLYTHRRLEKNCHGTGDMFAACFVGALMRGKDKKEAVKIAGDFVCRAIENTIKEPAHWYGVKFEPILPELIRMLEE